MSRKVLGLNLNSSEIEEFNKLAKSLGMSKVDLFRTRVLQDVDVKAKLEDMKSEIIEDLEMNFDHNFTRIQTEMEDKIDSKIEEMFVKLNESMAENFDWFSRNMKRGN